MKAEKRSALRFAFWRLQLLKLSPTFTGFIFSLPSAALLLQLLPREIGGAKPPRRRTKLPLTLYVISGTAFFAL